MPDNHISVNHALAEAKANICLIGHINFELNLFSSSDISDLNAVIISFPNLIPAQN